MNKETNITYRPHDALFKGVFGNKKEATELLKSHLPPEVLAKIDLSKIEIVNSDFIREDLRDRHSDLVVKTNKVVYQMEATSFAFLDILNEPAA